jgi:serine/threonine protein kinase
MGLTGSHQSDLFSLAVIVYEMITGRLPYPERSPKAVKLKHYSELHYTPSKSYRADVPVWVEAALQAGLSANPDHRYQSLSEFFHDLSMPNRSLEAKLSQRPIMERNPLRFWQLIAAISIVVNLLQWVGK